MNESRKNSTCAPLMEACTLALYQKNIFRVTGLPVDATSKEVSRQAQKLQMLEEYSGGTTGHQAAFPLSVPPTTDEIRAALSRMKEPEHRIVDEFFWYWPEEFGASKSDPAIQSLLAGDADGAIRLWVDREKGGSCVAVHNMAIMYHMYAVDWTNYQLSDGVKSEVEEKIKGYWKKSFERWEKLVHEDRFWNILKERIRSLNDEALTTGFVRRMLKELPEALDRINAEAALRMAEQGSIESARFHVNFMRETHQGLDDVDSTSEMVLEPTKKRVEQYLKTFEEQADENPTNGADLAIKLLERCRPMMDLFDLFHGEDAHQRSDLFDRVAETVLQMVISHQHSTGDNWTFVKLLQKTLEFASGTHVRERIIKNISIGESNLSEKLIEDLMVSLKRIQESNDFPEWKLQLMNRDVLPELPALSQRLSGRHETHSKIMDAIAIVLRSISIDANNQSNDLVTAKAAIDLAAKLVVSPDLKHRIQDDIRQLNMNAIVLSSIANSASHRRVSPKKPSSGCLVLFLMPGIAGISIIYNIVKFFA
jgi:hypothetical protein